MSDLISLYQTAFERSSAKLETLNVPDWEQPTHPLLIAPSPSYLDSPLRVMYYGQETRGYEGAFPKVNVSDLLRVYAEFPRNRYRGPFWDGIRFLHKRLQSLQPGSAYESNNLIKMGKDYSGGTPSEKVIQWQDHWFDVHRNEMEILQPDVVVFFSGPRYDRFIERAFGPVEFEAVAGFDVRSLASVRSSFLPALSFRTYHPGYSRRNGLFKLHVEEIFDAVRRGFGAQSQ